METKGNFMMFEKQNEDKLKVWNILRRSEKISLLEEYELSMLDFDSMSEDQKKKFKRLVTENMSFREKADWSIICDLKKIDENLIIEGIRR